MSRQLSLQSLRRFDTVTHEGAAAYDYSKTQALTHLTFTMGAALLTDGYYTTEQAQVRSLAEALLGAHRVEPRFAWQYGAWMRDPKDGKGNRIQGSLVPALLDTLTTDDSFTTAYVAKCLGHRVDDVVAFFNHYVRLDLGEPSAAARAGAAQALCQFDEYQLMKYKSVRGDGLRLCDAIFMLKPELKALGASATLVLAVGEFLHAPTRRREALMADLPLTQARRTLFQQGKGYCLHPDFPAHVARARVTWEQVLGHFGTSPDKEENAPIRDRAVVENRAVWEALLAAPGLMPDMALMRNVRNLSKAGFSQDELIGLVTGRKFRGVWPHQIYAGFKAVSQHEKVFSAVMQTACVSLLPPGRHLGVADISGSMGVKVGGLKGSTTAMDVSLCLTGLMSESSGLGASFDSGIHIAERRKGESPLKFTTRPEINRGWGSTQIFGAIMELVVWLKAHPKVKPPECLWFFSDMQFHPARTGAIPKALQSQAKKLGIDASVPPAEAAIQLYRHIHGPVDVVFWNLAAYSPVPVPSTMAGVLLVSGFDANTFKQVQAWREGTPLSPSGEGRGKVEDNQAYVLDHVRSY